MKPLSIIVAVAENGAIGRGQQLLCHLPEDLKRFKAITLGKTIVMGRKTFDSLPKGALPGRRNRVLTAQADWQAPGVAAVHSVEEAFRPQEPEEELFVIGGVSLYEAALPVADRLYLTRIGHCFDDADTFFPPIDLTAWRELFREEHAADERHPYPYTFIDYERVRP